MTIRKLITFLGLLFMVFSDYAYSALPPLPIEMLKKMSDLIVIGKVKNIRTEDSKSGGSFVKRHYYIDVTIIKVEKGTIENKNKQIQAVGWAWEKTEPGWAGPGGVHGIYNLEKNDKVRLYLAGKTIVEPNGLEILKDEGKKP